MLFCYNPQKQKIPKAEKTGPEDFTLFNQSKGGIPIPLFRRNDNYMSIRQVFWFLDHPTHRTFPGYPSGFICGFRPQIQRRDHP